MKVTVAFAVIACCVLGYFCGQTEAFECYVCADSNDCTDSFTTSNKQDNCAMCSKYKVKKGDVQEVQRSCLTMATGISTGCKSDSTGGVSGDLCYCNSALCNASTRASMPTALLFLLPALILSLRRL